MRVAAALCVAAAVAALWLPRRRVPVAAPRLLLPGVAGVALGALLGSLASSAGAPPAMAIAAGTLGAPIPIAVSRGRRRRAAAAHAEQWPDFLAAVRGRVAGGSPIPEAVRAAGAHTGGRFAELDVGIGAGFEGLMADMRSRWADPVADRVFTTLAAASTIGGSRVDAILAHLSDSIASDLSLRRAHDAALTQQRLTAGVALVAPWAILVLTLLTNPGAAEAYATQTGNLIIAGGLVATLAGYGLAVRTARLSRPPRLFR